MRCFSLVCFLLSLCLPLAAQMPSEALLIINGTSLEATKAANEYAALRHFPAERILVLHPPADFFRKEDGSPLWTVSEEAARAHLLEPVLARLEELDDDSPTALILSPEWPTRVSLPERPEISITGYLGCRGAFPEAEQIRTGRFISPWFSMPPDTPQNSGKLLRYPISRELSPPFHPAAMLGVFYAPQTPEKVEKSLRTAVRADFRQPVGSVVFETNADVRTRTRIRQFQSAAERLRDKEIPVALLPAGAKLPGPVIGVMGGTANMNTAHYASALTPGAFADHLTSHAGDFNVRAQTKLTQWLDAGAAASAGTVTEPYAIWMKFPEAAVFERYFRGNTLLEALMQSVAFPYQLLIVGDPLCRPWAASLDKLSLETHWEDSVLTVKASGVTNSSLTSLHLFVDGQRVEGNGPEWTLPLNAENTGPDMELILHARYLWAPPQVGSLRKQISTPFPKDIRLSGSEKKDHVLLKIRSREDLMLVEVFRGPVRILSRTVTGGKPEIPLSLTESGTGPVTLRVKAVTAAGDIRWSNLVDLRPKPPR